MSETAAKPRPTMTEYSRPYWEAARQHRLTYQRCRTCGSIQFPFQSLCRSCQGNDLAQDVSSGRGTVYTFSTVYRAASEAFKADLPYTVALVELAEGYMMLSNIVEIEPEDVAIGLPVEVLFEDLDEEISLPKFRRA